MLQRRRAHAPAAEDIILHDAIRAVPGRIAKHRWPNQATGPGLLTAALQPWLKYADVRLFGPDLFYPLPYSPAGRAEIDGNNAARVAAAYAVHHWAGSWLSSMEGKPP